MAGLCTAGLPWPPQVREYLLKQKKVAEGRADSAEQVKELIAYLKSELVKHQKDVKTEMKNVRKEFVQVKTELEAVHWRGRGAPSVASTSFGCKRSDSAFSMRATPRHGRPSTLTFGQGSSALLDTSVNRMKQLGKRLRQVLVCQIST